MKGGLFSSYSDENPFTGPQPHAVDPSFILKNSYLFPVFMAKNQ